MTDDNALEMLHKLFDEAGASCMQVDNYLNVAIGDLRANFSEYKDGTLCMTLQNFVTPEQAIAVTLGSDDRYDAGFASGVQAVFQQLEGIEDYEGLQDLIAEYWGEGEGNDER